MPANPGEDDAPQGPASDSISLDSFSGLRNTVLPERLGPRELARARNIDLDDAGEMHRRRGQTLVSTGKWHSLFVSTYRGRTATFGVNDGTLCILHSDFSTAPILGGMPATKLSWAQVASTVYFSCRDISGKIDLLTMGVSQWGVRQAHDYYPQSVPAIGRTFWLSPVPQAEPGLGPVSGRLLGPPPLGSHICYFQGRLYIAQGPTLWATVLYGYNFVDKTEGYRQFEDEITGLAAVEDGMFVGTRTALYFVAGTFKEQRRTLKISAGVIPGTMVVIPGDIADPEARRRPDVPHEASPAISCMTSEGLVVGFKGGTAYNLTKSAYRFPAAVAGTSAFRSADGYNSMVTVLESDGTPETAQAAFGDYVNVQLIRNGQVINASPPADKVIGATPGPKLIIEGLDGTILGEV